MKWITNSSKIFRHSLCSLSYCETEGSHFVFSCLSDVAFVLNLKIENFVKSEKWISTVSWSQMLFDYHLLSQSNILGENNYPLASIDLSLCLCIMLLLTVFSTLNCITSRSNYPLPAILLIERASLTSYPAGRTYKIGGLVTNTLSCNVQCLFSKIPRLNM